MRQSLKSDDRFSWKREVSNMVEERSACKMLVALKQASRRDIVKYIRTNTGDDYCVPGTVQISAVGDR
jgi:hypothetical protein